MTKCVIDFHPRYLHENFGVDYGWRYHWDLEYRGVQDELARAGLARRFADFPELFPAPDAGAPPSRIEYGWQPLDCLSAALGGEMIYSPDESIQSGTRVLQHATTREAIAALPELDWSNDAFLRNLCMQLELRQRQYPEAPITYAQFATITPETKQAVLITHSPYTTGFRLAGEVVFELMLLEPDTAFALFDYIMRQYRNAGEWLAQRYGFTLHTVHFGDCAATLLSPELFADFNVKLMNDYARAGWNIRWHSCGKSTHLLHHAAQIERLEHVDLGAGTDWALARKLLPEVEILAFYSSAELLAQTPDQVRRQLDEMARQLQDNFIIVASSIDPRTDERVLRALMEKAGELNL